MSSKKYTWAEVQNLADANKGKWFTHPSWPMGVLFLSKHGDSVLGMNWINERGRIIDADVFDKLCPKGWLLVKEKEVAADKEGSFARGLIDKKKQKRAEAKVPPNVQIEGFSLKPESYRIAAYAREVVRLARVVQKLETAAALRAQNCAACESNIEVKPRECSKRRYGCFTVNLCTKCFRALRSYYGRTA